MKIFRTIFNSRAGKIAPLLIACLAAFFLIVPLEHMLEGKPPPVVPPPHQDPETAQEMLGAAHPPLLSSEFFNLMLRVNSEAEVEALLGRLPAFPRNFEFGAALKLAIEDLTVSGLDVSRLWVQVHDVVGDLEALRKEFRLAEAVYLTAETEAQIAQARSGLQEMKLTAATISEELKASPAAWRNLEPSYDRMIAIIDRMTDMLDLRREALAFDAGPGEQQTSVTLHVEPAAAWVGETVRVRGTLASEGQALPHRAIDIAVNGSRQVTVETDARGDYRSTLVLPYLYVPALDLRALYSPEETDAGRYAPSLSEVSRLKVLFYETGLKAAAGEKAYPGLKTTVSGEIDYGTSPPAGEREVEISLDDVPVGKVAAQAAFSREIEIDPAAEEGEHVITVSVLSGGRYAPASATAFLDITRETPVLDVSIPPVVLVPGGGVELRGELHSAFGPVAGAAITATLDGTGTEAVTLEDGSFAVEVRPAVGFGVAGSRDLAIQVSPREPWHAPLRTTSGILVVNVVSSAGIVLALVLLGIYLPGRLRRWRTNVVENPAPATAPAGEPGHSSEMLTPGAAGQAVGDPRARIFHWYRLTARWVGRVTRIFLQPQQTLREFAGENARVLGVGARYFVRLTATVERVLYSPYVPTKNDVEKSRQLWRSTEREVEIRKAPAQQGPAAAGETAVAGQWRVWGPPAGWLRVVFMLAVTYYACVLLFLLALLLAAASR